jgi:hypothetical protein
VVCVVKYASTTKSTAKRARWSLAHRGRVAAHGRAAVSHGRIRLDLRRLRGLRRGGYTLTVTVDGRRHRMHIRIG